MEHRTTTSTGRTSSAHGPADGRIAEQGSTVAAPVAGRSDWIGPLDTEYTTVPAQQSLSHAARLDALATAGFVKSRYFETLRRRYHWDGRVPLLVLPDEMKKRNVKLVFIGDSKFGTTVLLVDDSILFSISTPSPLEITSIIPSYHTRSRQ